MKRSQPPILATITAITTTITTASLFGACVNMSTLQTARTLKPGERQATIGGGYYESPELNAAVEDATEGDVNSLSLPYTELAARVGVAQSIDVGLKATLPGTTSIDGKFQFVDMGGLAVAGGAGLGYLSIESGTDDDPIKSSIFETQGTLYVSYDLSPGFALYAAPKYIGRFFGGDASGTSHMVGSTGGIKLGKRAGLYLETTWMTALGAHDFTAKQFNGSVFFGF